MKKFLLSLLTFCAFTASAQTEIVVGDMNDDGLLTVGDVTALTETVIGKAPRRTISTKCDPNASDPSAIAGSWRAVGGATLTLTTEGHATYSPDATVHDFEYYPYGRVLVLLNEGGYAVKYIPVVRLSADYLVLGQPDGSCTAYYPGDHFANGFVMSATTLALKTGQTQQLSVLATPEGSIAPVFTWTSSSPAVATVDQNGLVTAVKGGTATITATAQDGSSVNVECSVSVVQLVESITLSAETLTLAVDESTKLTVTVLPEDAGDRTYTWSSSNEDVAEVTRNGVVYANGYGRCIITATANDGSGVKAKCVIEVAMMHNGHAYVDLGLPSGTLWATCNVGADNPEDYGDYFAWGEVEPKSTYNWSTYFDSNCEKYNNIDGKTVLDLEDDAAYMNWGEGWRMPSIAQQEELCDTYNCTRTWTTINGKNGYLVKSTRNDASLFLPAAGFRDGGSLYYAGSLGRYWPRSGYSLNAVYLYFNSSDFRLSYNNGYIGLSVRPVRVSSQN